MSPGLCLPWPIWCSLLSERPANESTRSSYVPLLPRYSHYRHNLLAFVGDFLFFRVGLVPKRYVLRPGGRFPADTEIGGDGAVWVWNLAATHFYGSRQVVEWSYHAPGLLHKSRFCAIINL